MPLNTSTFLVTQGWQGLGVPLDGKGGRGLKKPLAIPQKRTLSGIGKDRDRANEWWDSIFAAGAKNLSIGSSSSSPPSVASSSGTSTPVNVIANTTNVIKNPNGMSLASLAKREHARKTLMNRFIRGEVITSKDPSPEPQPRSSCCEPSPSLPQSSKQNAAVEEESVVEKAIKAKEKTVKVKKNGDGDEKERKPKNKDKQNKKSNPIPADEESAKSTSKKRKRTDDDEKDKGKDKSLPKVKNDKSKSDKKDKRERKKDRALSGKDKDQEKKEKKRTTKTSKEKVDGVDSKPKRSKEKIDGDDESKKSKKSTSL